MTKLHLVSDLHTEFALRRELYFHEKADYLLVAGDTVPTDYLREERTDDLALTLKETFLKLVQSMLASYEFVIFVMGNHEHYRGDIDASQKLLTDFFVNQNLPLDRVVVLENDVIEIKEGVKLFAASLWTDMFGDNPCAHAAVWNYMNDYRLIRKGGRIFKPSDSVNNFRESFGKLQEALKSNPDDKFIVMTHHCPSALCTQEMYRSSWTSAGYYSHLEDFIIDNPQIMTWVCGHTHYKFDFVLGETRVVSNPLGYPPERSSRNVEEYGNFRPHNVVIEV